MESSLQILRHELIRLTETAFPENAAAEVLESQLAEYINRLIQEDFDQLIRLLYRIDVSEPRLKQLLREHPDQDAGVLIARMIIDRQWEKMKSRAHFRSKKEGNGGEAEW